MAAPNSALKVLNIPITRVYFEAIRAGTKTEEYRAYSPFWISRLLLKNDAGELDAFRAYDIVRFRNGYAPDAPVMDVEFKHTILEEFADEPEDSDDRFGFAIVLGEVLRVENVE